MCYGKIGLLFFLCALLNISPCYAMEKIILHNGANQQFSRWIKSEMQLYEVPSVSIVVIRNYKIAWEGYYGVKNILTEQPITDTTLFQAGSISKPVTAIAVLKAAQDGKLNIDEDINHFLSSWTVAESPYLKDEFLTARKLLSHTAGINVPGFMGYSTNQHLPSLNEILNGKSPANSPEIKVIQPPGQYLYSGGGYAIVQQLLTDIYQQPFNNIMYNQLFHPLGMMHSTFMQQLTPEMEEQIATPYRPGNNSIKSGPHRYVTAAAAGLWSTPFDLAKLIISIQKALHNDPFQLLSPKSVKIMLTPEAEHMGLGFYVNMNRYGEPVKKGSYFTHSGQTEGYQSMVIASVRDGNGAIIMTNMSEDARSIIGGSKKSDWRFIDEVVDYIADMEDWR